MVIRLCRLAVLSQTRSCTSALSGRGVHNEVGAEGRVAVECHDGQLVLCEGRRRVKHG